MSIVMIISTAIGLAMDAFAVSISNGICYPDMPVKRNAFSSAMTFGVFQGVMSLAGYLLGNVFKELVESIDHWIALMLLVLIGGKMIYDGIQERKNPELVCAESYTFKGLMVQGLATSIDAMAVGIGFAVINVNILFTCLIIGAVTFLFSLAGVYIGKNFGRALSDKAQFIGGAILIFIGIKIFCEHTILA